MKVSLGRHRHAALAALAGLFLAPASALAQTPPQIPPPASYSIVDARGVNLFSGQVTVSTTPITIGDPAQGGLSYLATWDTSVSEWRNSVAGMVTRTPVAPPNNVYPWYTVTVMGETAIFWPKTPGNYVPVDGIGTLIESGGIFTYTALDGTVSVFGGGGTYSPFLANEGLISTMTRPNGEVITFTYTSVALPSSGTARRLQSVNNNLGYQLHFEYAGNGAWNSDWDRLTKVTAVNNAVDYCAPTATTCSYSQTWPSLTFAETSTQRSVTDSLSRTTRLRFGSDRLLGIARPTTPSGDNVTIAWTGTPLKATSVSDGAGTWTYTYTVPPTLSPPPVEQTYSTAVNAPGASGTTVVEISDTEVLTDPAVQRRLQRIASVTNAVGDETLYNYDILGNFRLYSIIYPEGNGLAYGYTDRGDLASVTRTAKPGSGLADTSTTATFADCSTPILCGRPTAITDARGITAGYTTDYTYAAHGGLLTATRPAGPDGVRPQDRYTWAAQSAWYRQSSSTTQVVAPTSVWRSTAASACSSAVAPACVGTANEVRTTTAYQVGSSSVGSNVLPVTVSSGAGNGSLTATTQMTYTNAGDVQTVQSPLGASDTTWSYYDAMRQQTGVIAADPDGAGARLFPATRTTYNADGQVTTAEQGTATGQGAGGMSSFAPLQTATTIYNAQARVSREQSAPGTAAAALADYAYDGAGNLTCTAQRMNPANFGDAPTDACALTTAGAFGPDRITRNTYDAADRLTQVQTGYASGNVLTERLQGWTDNGHVDWIEDGAGNRSDYVYDGFDRLDRLYFPATTVGTHVASTTDYEQYGYDANDNPTTKRTRANTTFTTAFDNLNRISSIDAPSGSNDVWYLYDSLNRRLSAAHASGAPSCTTTAVCTTWDALGRQITEQTALGTMTSAWDLAGRRTQLTWPDAVFVTYQYDLDDLMVGIKLSNVTSIISYAYDDWGRRTTATRGNGVVTNYGYDAASRLTSLGQNLTGTASDITYGYTHNPASQIVTLGRSNNIYAYAGVSGSTAYGNNGLNQTTSLGGTAVTWSTQGNLTNDGTRTYSYDSANRMTGTGSSTLSYDPLDRLAQMVGTSGGRYLYDGNQIAGVITAASGTAINNRLILGPRPDELVVAYQGSGTTTPLWTLQDHLGSSIAITDATGAAIYTMAYDEYGAPRSGNAGRLQYTGQLWLPDFAAYHHKARVYRPDLGRFLQTDPVGYAQGLNLYAYVANDPVNNTDPTGMVIQDRYEQQSRLNDRIAVGDPTVITPEQGAASASAQLRVLGPILQGAAQLIPNPLLRVGVSALGRNMTATANAPPARTGPDFVVARDGTVMRPTAQGQRADLEAAGMPGRPTNQSSETGTVHTTPNGRTDIRIMDGGSGGPPRAVTTQAGQDRVYVEPSSGQRFPHGTSRQDRRDRGHREFPQ